MRLRTGLTPRLCETSPRASKLERDPGRRRPGGAPSVRSAGVAGSREPSVEIEGGADEREVCEGLREVAEVLRLGPELLAVQPKVIGVPEHLFEEEPRLVQVPHTRKALDVPERAHRERALLPREPVREPVGESVAIHQ